MVSKRLSRLEADLGVRLLHRSTRRLALTVPGERLHADLLTITADLARAEARVRGEPDRPSGPLRLSAPTSFGRMHLAPHLGRFIETYPAVALSVDLSDDYIDLMDGGCDLALRITSGVPPRLASHRLAANERILCAAPAYLKQHGVPETIADLRDHRLLAASGQLPWRLENGGRTVTVDGTSHVRTNSSELVRELAIAGVGIALRSLWDIDADTRAGRLVRVLPRYEGLQQNAIYAVHLRQPHLPRAMAVMIAFLQALYQPHPPWAEREAHP